jgi:hypothetical protein
MGNAVATCMPHKNIRYIYSNPPRFAVQKGAKLFYTRDKLARAFPKTKTKKHTLSQDELETVKEFKYLGRITSDDDDDLPQ